MIPPTNRGFTMRATTTILATAALLLGSPLLSGCGNNSNDTGSGGGGGSQPISLYTFPTADCPFNYPIPLTVSTTNKRERPFVKNVVACTSDEQYGPVWLHNIGGEVWTMDNQRARSDLLGHTHASNAFHLTFQNSGELLLDPGDELLVHAPPAKVSWTLSRSYTLGWDTQSVGLEQLKSFSAAAYLAAVKKHSPEHQALATCTLAGYNAADTWTGNPDGFDENLSAALGTGAGATGCAATWKIHWLRDFLESASQYLDHIDSKFRILSTLVKHIAVFRP